MRKRDADHAEAAAEAAARYAEQLGWRILHTHGVLAAGGCTCHEGAACNRPGKHPDGKDFTAKATTDAATLRSRWALVPFNLALFIPDDIVVIDCDTLAGLQRVKMIGGTLPAGPLVQTVRGAHLYYRWPRRFPSPSIGALDGHALDVLGSGSLVTLPPSRTAYGTSYTWRRGLSPFDVAIPDLPATLAAHLEHVDRQRAARRIPPVPLTTVDGAVAFARQRAKRARMASNGAARGEYGLARTLEEAGATDAVRDRALEVFRAEVSP